MKRERAENLFNLLGDIDDKIIAEADVVKKKPAQIVPMNKKRRMPRYVTVAASIAFLLVCVWGVRGLLQFGMHGDDDMATNVANDDWEDDLVAEAEDDGDWDEAGDEWADRGELADRPVDFVHQLTDEQLSVVFPALEFEIFANALFLNDGTLIEVEGFVQMPTGEQLRIRIAEDEIQHTVITVPDTTLYLNVYDVEIAIHDQRSTSFMLENIAYYIEFFDQDVVRQIILGGPADLSVLSGVIIP